MPPSDLNGQLERTLAPRGQQHLLRWWDELTDEQQADLHSQVQLVPWELVDAVLPTHVLGRPPVVVPAHLDPAPIHSKSDLLADPGHSGRIVSQGKELLAGGKVAALTVAGGQGTRLGFEGPKGMFPVTPVRRQTLFGLFAEMVRAARTRYAVPIAWYVMTSEANHGPTVAYFEQQRFFGLRREEVVFFTQGMLPAFDFQGRVLMADKHRIALAPDGHGGTLRALAASGALTDLRRRGVEVLSYFQIDNPLAQPFDPMFIGLHAETGSEASTKVTPKVADDEKVGVACLADGRLRVIEYTEFPPNLTGSRFPDGRRRFDAGNLAIHLFDVAFVERLVGTTFQLPLRRAEKIVPYIGEDGSPCKPRTPNAVKLEMFIFDVLPLARNPLVLEVERADEFAPVKNANGADSLETSQRAQVERCARWLEKAEVPVPRRPTGECDLVVEMTPQFALDAEDVICNRHRIPPLRPGSSICLDA